MRSTIITFMQRVCLAASLLIFTGSLLASPAHAIDRFAQSKKHGLAIKGFDATAYSTDGKAEAGTADHTVKWKGAKWRFASAEDAAAFEADPDAYAPQFGGYCTRAMSKKITIAASPKIWRIYKGKLYMFFAPVGLKKFNEGPDTMIRKAQAHWDTLKKTE